MKRWIVAVAALGVVAGGGVYFLRATGETGGTGARRAPEFELRDSRGSLHRLPEELKGKTIVLHFWASWCPPCLDEIGEWTQLAEKFRGQPVALVAVSLDTKWEDALKILPEAKLPAGVLSLLDPEQKISDRFGSYQFPETYLLARDGTVAHKWVGPQDWSGEAARKLIERALASPL
jgi:peroxiredoxin